MNRKIIIFVLILVLGFVFWKLDSKTALNSLVKENTVEQKNSEIQIFSLKENQVVNSPLKILGKAKGSWFFEGSFPIKIYDSNNTNIGSTVAKANGEWMTENFVDFTADLTFTSPLTETGKIVFMNSNPSGLEANNKIFEVKIMFK